MDLLKYFDGEIAKEKLAIRTITDSADEKSEPLKEDERAAVKAHLATIAELQAKKSGEQEKMELRAAVDGFDTMTVTGRDPNPVNTGDDDGMVSKARTPGDAFVQSEGFRLLQAKVKAGGGVPKFTVPPVQVPIERLRTKAAGDPVLESDSTSVFGTGGNAGAFTTIVPPAFPLQPANLVADLIPSVPVTVGNSASWLVIDTRVKISGTPVTEGAAKPGGEYVVNVESEVLQTIAGWIKISNQYVEDAPSVVAYINQDLPYQVRFNENAYLLAGLYTAAGLSADGTTLQASPNSYDAIREAIALIQENNGVANGLVISPTDWATMQTEKFGTDFSYIGGGPGGNNPWGLNVVVTPAATDGLPLVGDFNRAARVFRRGGVNIDSTNSDGTDFQKNLITIRAEERLVLGVSYPYLLSVAVIGTS